MRRNSFSRFTFLALLLGLTLGFISVQTAWADQYARIQGTVMDPSGAALAGVKLTATNTGTNASWDVTTGSDGVYVFLSLPIGTYKVTAAQPGFRNFAATGIVLTVDQVYVLNIKMELGQMTEQVVVEATNIQVQTANTQLGMVISGDKIRDMPLNGRNWIQLQQLQPGVMSSSDRFGTNFSTNGSQTQQNSYLINGQDSNDLPLNTPLIIPSPDAIAEFNLVTNTINPEYGRNSGAILNAVIRSGSNSFHGSAFDFYRDTFLNTTNFFQKSPAIFHQNQFGGTIGGPVWKNHTFFFFSYQGTRARQPQAFPGPVVFTQAQRNGDWSAQGLGTGGGTSPFPLFGDSASPCPVSGGTRCPAGTNYSTLFSTGVIPSQDFNPISVNLLNQFVPLPNAANNIFSFNPVTNNTADQEIVRIDQNFKTKDTLYGYAFIQRNPSTDTLPFTGATLPGFGQQAKRDYRQVVVAWNHIFSPTVLNEARVGYTRFNFVAVKPQNPVLPSSFGFDINPQNPADAGLPVIAITGFFTLGFSDNGPQPRIDQVYQFSDNFSYQLGKHALKFGFEMRRFGVSNPFFFLNSGHFNFGGNGSFSTGLPGVDFLLGIPDDYAQSSGGFIDAHAQQYYSYAQDSYKATSNLTINYGIGWQVDTPITDRFNNNRAINCFRPGQRSIIYPTAPTGLVFPGDKGCTPSGYNTGYAHFGPRLGFAWAPHWGWLTGGPGKFSIRAGVGVYFNRAEEELTLQNLLAPPFSLIDTGIGDVGGQPSFAAPFTDIATGNSIPNKYPFTPPPAGSAVDFEFFEPFSLNVLDPNMAVPYAVNYNLTVQRELPGQMILTVAYVGASARHLVRAYELNPGINPAACAASTFCVQQRNLQGFFFPENFKYPDANSLGLLIFGSVGQQATDGTSQYHSLQASVNKRFSHGLEFLAAYTYSHSIDFASSFENSSFGTRGTNPFREDLNRGDSEFDARHRFVASYTYAIPVLRSMKSGWLSRIFDGWRLAGYTIVQMGFPVNISNSGRSSLTCWAFTFYGCPDNAQRLVPKVETLDPRTSPNNTWFDPADFCRPTSQTPTCPGMPIGTFGNAGRNSIHGPGIWNTNLAILKGIKLNETMSVELRLESFNTFNHAQFNNPNGNRNSSLFGRITTAKDPRLVQLAAKFYF
jgi:hypothetical protein